MKKSLLLTLALALVLALCCAVASAEETCPHANLSTVTNPPKCGVDGAEAIVCADCGKTIESRKLDALKHIYVEIARVPATCVEKGISLTKCSICGDVQQETLDIDKTNHDWSGEWEVTTEATCYTDGKQEKKCQREGCKKTKSEDITKLGHDFEKDKVIVEPTCTKPGESQDYCKRCKNYDTSTKKEIPALGHDFVEIGITTKAETCNTNYTKAGENGVGAVLKECSRCKKQKTVPYYLEHVVVNEVKVATCIDLGSDKSYCAICETVFHEYTTNKDPNNHTKEISKLAKGEVKTCYKEAKYVVSCEGCKDVLREETKAPEPHGTIEVSGSKTFRAGVGHSVDPTCEKAGKDVYICSMCWYSNNNKVTVVSEEVIPATGHTWKYDSTESKNPTCRETGYNLYVCKNKGCDKQYKVELPKLEGHPVKITTINAAKCGVAGIEMKECTICNGVTWYEVIPALEHEKDEGKQTVAPTCDKVGEMTYVCKLCKKEFTEVIPEQGHDLGNYVTVKAAACTENGIESAKCSRCAYTVNRDIIALGHDLGNYVTVKAASCTENGIESAKCSRCAYTVDRDIKPTGHNYVCVVKNPTCTEAGLATYTCLNCGDIYTESIPALGHDYETVIVRDATINRHGEKADICAVCGDKQNVQKIEYVAMQFGANMSLDGIKLSELDPTKTSDIRVAVVDTTVDGTYTFNLVADNKWTIGTATVTVANGTVTVNYRVDGFKVKNETITVFSSLDALKANEGIAAANGQPVAFSGNTAFIALDAIVDFCHGDYRVNNYNENTKLIADMKALIA